MENKQENLICQINETQLYNIPLPYLILSFLTDLIPFSERERKYIDDEKRERWINVSDSFEVYETLNTFFKRENLSYASIYMDSKNSYGNFVERSEKVLYYQGTSFKLSKLLNEFITKLSKIDINVKLITFKIPIKARQKQEGMTDYQYADYVLGYKIVEEYFSEFLNIEYYRQED